MSDPLAILRARVLDATRAVVPGVGDEVLARADLSATKDAAHGDLATNVAMIAAKAAGEKPQALAARIVAALADATEFTRAEVAGPGFINLTVAEDFWRGVVPRVLRAGETYGESDAGGGRRVNVEYVSANPTGPLTVGHARGTIVGDVIATTLARTGHAVTREYYINDAGGQIRALAWAAYGRYLRAIGSPMSDEDFAAAVPGGLQYPGEYLIPVGEALARDHGAALATAALGIAPEELWMATVRDTVVAVNMAGIREDLAAVGVHHDVFYSEATLIGRGLVDAAIERLRADGLLYEGVLEPPKGKTPDDWEPRAQTLFRSERFGDDVDRALRKSDGSNTYFANDIAYHADKVARGAEVMIDVWGADHGGYVKRMQAAASALTPGAKLEIVVCQIVRVIRDGQPVRMSKRAGTFVTLRDLIDEVGRDAVRFTMLTRRADAQMDFDLDAVVAQTRENPVYYVQYAHARCRSVLRAASAMLGDVSGAALAEVPLGSLADPAELAVMRRLAAWPGLLEGAARTREPHRVAYYLGDLAADFHGLWNRGNADAALRFLQEGDAVATRARVALVAAVAVTIRAGLSVVGVAPVEEMR